MKKRLVLINNKVIRLKNGSLFPLGVYFAFSPLDNNFVELEVINHSVKFKMSYVKLHEYFDIFQSPPIVKEFNNLTPLGLAVEADGTDEYGFPTWKKIN